MRGNRLQESLIILNQSSKSFDSKESVRDLKRAENEINRIKFNA